MSNKLQLLLKLQFNKKPQFKNNQLNPLKKHQLSKSPLKNKQASKSLLKESKDNQEETTEPEVSTEVQEITEDQGKTEAQERTEVPETTEAQEVPDLKVSKVREDTTPTDKDLTTDQRTKRKDPTQIHLWKENQP